MNPYIQAILFFIPPIIAGLFYLKALYAYMQLYREKKNLDYPVLPQEISTYFYMGAFDKILLNPLIMIEVIFAKHTDKELAAAAKKVRLMYLIYIGISILMVLVLFLTIFYF